MDLYVVSVEDCDDSPDLVFSTLDGAIEWFKDYVNNFLKGKIISINDYDELNYAEVDFIDGEGNRWQDFIYYAEFVK